MERFDLALADDEAFAFDYFVAPQYRSRGTALEFLLAIYAALAKDGYCAVWCSVDAENVGARWVYRTSGSIVVRQQISRELC